MDMRLGRRALVGMRGAGLAGRAAAQPEAPTWPRQPVRVIVPAAGGGSSDPIARICAQDLARRFGQPFVIDNRPGASGNVGMAAAARAPADGSTLLFSWAGPLATNLALYPSLGFHPQRDFDPIVRFGAISNALIVGRN